MGNKAGETFTVNFDGGGPSPLRMLFNLYLFEHDNPDERKELEEYYKNEYPKEFEKFLKYEKELEKRTLNIKQIYFDYLDGKIEHPGWEYFTPEGMDLD